MAKKGNLSINKKDFAFDGDEMFPLDDSVFDDDFDELSGFKFDPKGEEVTGVRGFFKNTLKSVKGLGLDFVDQFVPELSSIADDTKMALSESLDSFIDKKDKALNKFKEMTARKPDTSILKSVGGAFKNTLSDIKKGKFYTSDRDKPIDMDAFMGDDDDDDDSESSYQEDTSGKMTTSFNYKAPRKRRSSKLIINNDNSGMINAMAEMQQSATVATGTINTKLANRQLRASNEHFYASIKVLNNIADNVYGISNFLMHYGKTDLKAQLEYDSKSLAFLTDQRALLKDILRGINTTNGIFKNKDGSDDEREKRNFMKFGSFDMSKYFNHIKSNAKEMFLGTDIGMGFEMLSGLSGMMGKSSGIKMSPMDMIPSMVKGVLFNQMMGTKTKARLERLNDLFGGIGGTLVSKANKWKDSDNTILNFIGNLLGTDQGVNKYLDMNKVDINQQSPLDVGTKESINVVIPGYLSKILSAITGEEETYFDHQTKRYRTNSSLKQRYDQAIDTTIASNIRFTSGINIIEGGMNALNKDKQFLKRNKNYKPISNADLQKAVDKFKMNLIETKIALDPYLLASNPDYSNKLFKGFDSLGKENAEQLKDMIVNQVSAMSKSSIYDLNNSLFKVASDIENRSKSFKEDAIKYGGMLTIAQINEQERWAEMDYKLKYSSRYNEKYAGKNEFSKQRARIAAATAKRDMFDKRGGVVDVFGGTEPGSISYSAFDKISNIFDLLAGGIIVYPVNDPTLANKRLTELGKIVKTNNTQKEQREQNKLKEAALFKEMRKTNTETAVELAREEKVRKHMQKYKGSSNSIMNNIRSITGTDSLISGVIDVLSKPLDLILGKDTVSEMIETGGNDQETLRMAEERYKQSKVNAKKLVTDVKSTVFKNGKKSSAMDKVNTQVSKMTAQIDKKASESELKRQQKAAARKEYISKHGSLSYQLMGSNATMSIHNAAIGLAGQKGTIYIDPSWWEEMDDTDPAKILWTSVIQGNGLKLVTYLDSAVDIAVSPNYSSDEKQTITRYGIKTFGAKKDSAQAVAAYVNSKNFMSDVYARSRKRGESARSGATTDYLSGTSSGFDFKRASLISKIKNSKDAAKLFLDPAIQNEIDDLLSSGDEEAIFEFANKIKSEAEGMSFKDPEAAMRNLDPQFKGRLMQLFADPELVNKGVAIKDSVRSPLKQFAFYTKGRINPTITDKLLKMAGVKEGINYYPDAIKSTIGSDGITVRSLASNHMTGRAADINNGSLSYKKLSAIAGKYGIKWAGDKDKPHFEFDTSWKKGSNSNTSTSSTSSSGSMSATGVVSSEVQQDPDNTKVSGKAIEGKKVKNPFKFGKMKFIADRLINIEYLLERLAGNTENIGFGMGIPGVKGKGLIGRIGSKAKDIAKGAFGFAKGSLATIKTLSGKAIDFTKGVVKTGASFAGGVLSTGIGMAKGAFGKVAGLAKKGASWAIGKIGGANVLKGTFKTYNIDELIDIFNLEEKLNMSRDEIKNMFKNKNELIDYIMDRYPDEVKRVIDSGIGKGRELLGMGLAAGESLFNAAGGVLSTGIGMAKGAFGGAKDFIGKHAPGLKQMGSSILSAGKNILQNGFGGIKDLAGKGVSFVKDKFGGILGGLGLGGLFGGSEFQIKLLAKLDEIDRDIFLANGKVKPTDAGGSPANSSGTLALPAPDEGSYADQKSDRIRDEKLEREERIDRNIASIAAGIGTPTSAVLAANGNVEPEPNLTSMMMASYQNSEKQQDLLQDIKNKAGKGAGGGMLGGLASKIGGAGAALTIAAAGAGAAMLGKQVHNKVKSIKANWKQATFGEKISEVMGGGGSSNYDTAGNRIEGGAKAGAGFGLNQAVHVLAFAKGVSKIMPLFQKITAKIFSNPKIMAKLGGKAAASAVQKGFLATMKKALSKGMAKVAAKITQFTAKVSNPIGWGVFLAQLLYDIASGMSDADRYFKMGKGMKPTWPMRIAAGFAKALSGHLTFGLVPPEFIANLVFNAVGDKATKEQMLSAAEFDKRRAAIMEVDYNRLVEFETMTWTEMVFGGDKKRATILGFIKDKKDREGVNRFKTWLNDVYNPLDDMYKAMIKEYGGKVNKKISPEDTEGMERVKEFREAYLVAAQKYMRENNLYGLGPLGKKDKKADIAEHEEKQDRENIAAATATGSAELATEGVNAAKAGSSGITDSVKSGVAENAQADGINYKKLKDKSIAQNFKEGAQENIRETAKINANKGGFFSGIKNKFKSITSSKGFQAVKNVAGTLFSAAVPGIGGFVKGIKTTADAVAHFVSNRRESEASVVSMFNSKEGESQVLAMQGRMLDKSKLGQQRSIAALSPEFASRVEAFLKDPRVINHGVAIRETTRTPATQLAYFSKGRASRELTDKLMKQAGFPNGINQWPTSFQKPGDYVTWTLASNHFNGTAVDLEPGDLGYDKLGPIAAEYGIEWGGYWQNQDKPHFEMGDPNFRLPTSSISGLNSIATDSQADTVNYGALRSTHRRAPTISVTSRINKPKLSRSTSAMRITATPIRSSSPTTRSTTGKVTSNLVENQFNDLITISSEGVEIMRQLYEEQVRHNKAAEEALGNIIKGIGALGAIMAASNSGSNTIMPSFGSGITNGAFDNIAKGL